MRGEGLSTGNRMHLLFVDSAGIVHARRGDLEAHKLEFAIPAESLTAMESPERGEIPLPQIISAFRPDNPHRHHGPAGRFHS